MQSLLDEIQQPASEENKCLPLQQSSALPSTATSTTTADMDPTKTHPSSFSEPKSAVDVSTETSVPTYEQATSPDDTSLVLMANSAKASTAESGNQTLSLESILRPMMAEMMKCSMMVFAQIMWQKLKETILEADPQGVQHAVHITNQNLSQLADVIKAQNRLIEQERAKPQRGGLYKHCKNPNTISE